MHPWGGRSARSGSAEPVRGQRLRVGSVDGGIAIIEIPYLALTKDLPGVRDVCFDKVPGVGWSWG